jgi:hypothetical protein
VDELKRKLKDWFKKAPYPVGDKVFFGGA